MSHIRKEIYNYFTLHGIYLPKYPLDVLEADMKFRVSKGESSFSLLSEYISDSKYEKYTEKTKGQYVLEKKDRALSRRAIIRINEDGSQTEFESIYAAAMALGLHKNSVGNISKACDNGLVSYKHKWKWPEHTIAYVLGPSFGSTGEATPSTK